MPFTVCEDVNVPCSGWKNLVCEIIFANKQLFGGRFANSTE